MAAMFLPLAQASETIRCSSDDGRRNYCDADTRGGVTLSRQLSQASCIEGRSWGYDRRGIWVDAGCRAEFQVGGGGGWPGVGGGNTIRCESNDGRRKYCDADTRGGVSMIRQVSEASCIQDRTWGYDGRGIWVDNGCRAEFQVGGGGGGGWHGGGGGWGGHDETVKCESNDGRRKYCDINTRNGVTLIRQISQASCIQNRTWGFDRQRIWVDKGCRAEFRSGNGWDDDDNRPPVYNYPKVRVDTAGRGTYDGPAGNNLIITRGYVNTTGQAEVGLSGNDRKYFFYGEITSSDGRREFTMRITRTEAGPARGIATVRLNDDGNEVESINIRGAGFNGSFSR
jgi:hypothetical protein